LILSFVISKRYLCIIRLFLVAEACIDFFVISSERSCKGNLELPQIFIIFAAEEKISNNIFITSVRCNILAFSETPQSRKCEQYIYANIYKLNRKKLCHNYGYKVTKCYQIVAINIICDGE
jgi:hypothetical protein